MSVPTFIVGTGRCGSTMLSNMLREHPKVLSISEFFANVRSGGPVAELFFSEPIEGPRLWELIGAKKPLTSLSLRHGFRPTEYLYPYDNPGFRFSSQTGVPAILCATLPHLTDDPDALFDLLQEEVNGWGSAASAEHYRHLFDWLAEHFHRPLWIERSGAALRLVPHLLEAFPDARFVQIARDGRDAALSMQDHLSFRLGFVMQSIARCLGADPLASADRTRLDRVPAELLAFLPENFDIDAFRTYRVPVLLCAEMWAQQVVDGATGLRAVPPDRLLTLRYEDFFADPKRQLDTLTAFLGDEFIDEDWSARCAATVRQPRSIWRDLPDETARSLTEACRPGFEQLRAAGMYYDV